jgi:hypothetical protein
LNKKRTATKIIMPFDPLDLRIGGQSIFIDQPGFDRFIAQLFEQTQAQDHADVQVLRALDAIPSLDPFLVREHLGRMGVRPATCYLKISASDLQQMIGFANGEIEKLVVTAFGGASATGTLKLAGKILSNEIDAELAPLRDTLKMSPEDFSNGIFSWRGFLYFKWRHDELQEQLHEVLKGLASYKPLSTLNPEVKRYLEAVRPRLMRHIVSAIASLGDILVIYDEAYAALVHGKDPTPFRQFLLNGPKLFFQLGETTGVLSHIASFWRYRMGTKRGVPKLPAEDYADILMDFEEGLMCTYIDG